jgi:hypothetical protein
MWQHSYSRPDHLSQRSVAIVEHQVVEQNSVVPQKSLVMAVSKTIATWASATTVVGSINAFSRVGLRCSAFECDLNCVAAPVN